MRNNAFNMINKSLNEDSKIKNDFNQSGIYQINCSDCKSFYIGQTGRSFKSRFKEHIQALKSNNKTTMKSNYAEHLLKNNHNYESMEKNLTIIDYMPKSEKLDSKEDLSIFLKHKEDPMNLLNTHITLNNPIFEKINQLK